MQLNRQNNEHLGAKLKIYSMDKLKLCVFASFRKVNSKTRGQLKDDFMDLLKVQVSRNRTFRLTYRNGTIKIENIIVTIIL